jgi:hypothetical protein
MSTQTVSTGRDAGLLELAVAFAADELRRLVPSIDGFAPPRGLVASRRLRRLLGQREAALAADRWRRTLRALGAGAVLGAVLATGAARRRGSHPGEA